MFQKSSTVSFFNIKVELEVLAVFINFTFMEVTHYITSKYTSDEEAKSRMEVIRTVSGIQDNSGMHASNI